MSKIKLFFDTEFTGLHQGTTLISIGIISECGKTFYAEFTDYDITQLDDWLKENVISKLMYKDKTAYNTNYPSSGEVPNDIWAYGQKKHIRPLLSTWLYQFGEVEMWSDCLSYDWVLFNNIYGTAHDIPKNVFYIPFDICTLFYFKGIDPDISREDFVGASGESRIEFKHNAMWDAKVIKMCYEKLLDVS